MRIFCMIIAMVLFIGVIIALIEGHGKYKNKILKLDKKRFSFPDIYIIGYAVLEIIGFNVKSEKNLEKLNQLYELFGSRKAAKDYLLAVRAGQISYIMMLLPIGATLSAISNRPAVMMLGIIFTFLMVYDLERQISKDLLSKKEILLNSFPTVVSKLTLLVNSGMVLNEAWEKIAYGSDGELYKEMRKVIIDRRNGHTMVDAYSLFAKRCGVKEIDKFIAIMIQNMDKGGGELVEYLRDITTEMWKNKKHNSKMLIDKLNNKLMIPTFLIFVDILVLVMAPMFISMMGAF